MTIRYASRLHRRVVFTLAALVLCPGLAACVPSSSFVAVERLELHEAYREYHDNVLASGGLSQPTRQTLNLVPEAGDGTDVERALRALGESTRIDDTDRAFARAEIALRAAEGWRDTDPVRARRLHLLAAYEAARLVFPAEGDDAGAAPVQPFDRRYRLASGFYALAAGRYFLALMRPDSGWNGDLLEPTPLGAFSVGFENDDSPLLAYFFRDYEIAWGVRVEGLRNRYTREGVGIPLVARRAPGRTFPLEAYLPAGGYTVPLTAYLRFEPPGPTGEVRVHVGLADARTATHVCFGTRALPVAADYTAPYARQVVQDRARQAGRAALFGRTVAGSRFGVTISAPWDPTKIPLVMVHGLASSSESWRELTNDLLGSEELRGRYQIIHYTYPTTEPVLASAARFRRELAAFFDLVGYDPAVHPRLVVIGHSMGGLLAKTLAVDSGHAIWDLTFTVPPESLDIDAAARQRFEEALILEPWPAVGRLVFLGTPHRGSDAADGWLGWIGRRLIHLPMDFSDLLRAAARADPGQVRDTVRDWFARGRVTSVQSLSPAYPALQAFADLPVRGVPYHSIIGDAGRDSRNRPWDGYVTVESARIPGAESELLLPIEHAEFDRPAALNEVYRILRLHAAATGMPVEQARAQSCAAVEGEVEADRDP